MSSAFVRVERLSRVFDVSKPWLNRLIERDGKAFLTAVDDVTFGIERGETLGLVGESGSGKSTLAKMITGLLPPTSGRIVYGDTELKLDSGAAMRKLRRRFQMIFQDPFASLNPRWRVGDIIAEPVRAFGLVGDGAEARRRVEELLEKVGLASADAAKYPHEFSGGQRQRIAIARAVSARPEFIVCDEPTSALDVSVQAQILNLMRDLQDEFGLTYLFISHDLSVVRHVANRIGVLYLGRLIEVAAARTLFKAPQHPYTRMLLDAVPDLEMTGRTRKPLRGEIPNPINPPHGCAFHPRCPLAFDRCRAETPQLKATGPGKAACFAAEQSP